MSHEEINRTISEAIEPFDLLPYTSVEYSPRQAWYYRPAFGWVPREWHRALGASKRLREWIGEQFYSQMVRRDGTRFRAACGDNTLQWVAESGPQSSEELAVRECAMKVIEGMSK